MSELRTLQTLFLNHVLFEEGPPPFPIRPGGSLSPAGALDVYRRSHAARLVEALGATFPALRRVLGEEPFLELCRAYFRRHPPASHSLSDYGGAMAGFLEERPESRGLPHLAELADFEWAFQGLFHEAQHASLDPRALSTLDESSRLVFGKALRLRRHAYSSYALWKAREEPSLPGPGGPERLVLYKSGGEIFARPWPEEEFSLIEDLSRESLGEAIARSSNALSPARAAAVFHFLRESGIITRVQRQDKGENRP